MLGQQGGGGMVARAKVRTVKVKLANFNSFQGIKMNLIFNSFQASLSNSFRPFALAAPTYLLKLERQRRLAWQRCYAKSCSVSHFLRKIVFNSSHSGFHSSF